MSNSGSTIKLFSHINQNNLSAQRQTLISVEDDKLAGFSLTDVFLAYLLYMRAAKCCILHRCDILVSACLSQR